MGQGHLLCCSRAVHQVPCWVPSRSCKSFCARKEGGREGLRFQWVFFPPLAASPSCSPCYPGGSPDTLEPLEGYMLKQESLPLIRQIFASYSVSIGGHNNNHHHHHFFFFVLLLCQAQTLPAICLSLLISFFILCLPYLLLTPASWSPLFPSQAPCLVHLRIPLQCSCRGPSIWLATLEI